MKKFEPFIGPLLTLLFVICAVVFLYLLYSWTTKKVEDPQPGYVNIIPERSKEEVRKWILTCIEKAAVSSEEDPEDVVSECKFTANELFGECIRVKDRRHHYRRDWCSPPAGL